MEARSFHSRITPRPYAFPKSEHTVCPGRSVSTRNLGRDGYRNAAGDIRSISAGDVSTTIHIRKPGSKRKLQKSGRSQQSVINTAGRRGRDAALAGLSAIAQRRPAPSAALNSRPAPGPLETGKRISKWTGRRDDCA
ncbi:hypothetical protein EVAR_54249_1 [Eumeta japonica]|uniref:Uncharacterized protein n=1 Tax=Eumeta variegata TaxID=151549 RepID=A0A4C1YKH7_EUMVA|nr:hypothetical protein EVAR_54249_1 [Eumeta japonica]